MRLRLIIIMVLFCLGVLDLGACGVEQKAVPEPTTELTDEQTPAVADESTLEGAAKSTRGSVVESALGSSPQPLAEPKADPSTSQEPSGQPSQAKDQDDALPIEVPVGEWAAILVNPTHLLPDNFEVSLADFQGGQVDARIGEVSRRMFSDAQAEGISLVLVDAYRSYDRQNALYQKKVDSFLAKGYNREEAEKEAATITARPNTSEHQTGLALDIVTSSYKARDKGFAKTKAYQWLDANAHRYGFTLRYQENKQSITKVIFEPWHWRFVGVEAAAAMKDSGECYEEYMGNE